MFLVSILILFVVSYVNGKSEEEHFQELKTGFCSRPPNADIVKQVTKMIQCYQQSIPKKFLYKFSECARSDKLAKMFPGSDGQIKEFFCQPSMKIDTIDKLLDCSGAQESDLNQIYDKLDQCDHPDPEIVRQHMCKHSDTAAEISLVKIIACSSKFMTKHENDIHNQCDRQFGLTIPFPKGSNYDSIKRYICQQKMKFGTNGIESCMARRGVAKPEKLEDFKKCSNQIGKKVHDYVIKNPKTNPLEFFKQIIYNLLKK